MIRTAVLFLLVVFIGPAGATAAQTDVAVQPQAEAMFMLGVRQYIQLDYKSAFQTLKQTADLQPVHQRTTAAMVMAAKSAVMVNQFADAAALCTELLQRFPFSSYVEDAHYTLGEALHGMGRDADAAGELLLVLEHAQVRATRWHAGELLERIAPSFTVAELRALEARAVDDSARVLLSLLRGEAYARTGMADSAAAVARSIAGLTADKKILSRAMRLTLQPSAHGASDTVTVGVLLPYMNNLKAGSRERATSEDIARGIREAVREYGETSAANQPAIRLDIRDSQRQKDQIERIIGEWRTDSTVVGILGPLFSDEMMIAAPKAEEAHIPLISPTATGNNIASIGKYVFQASPDYAMRGALMAQYAVREAGLRNLAVLTTDEAPGSLLADAFALEVNRLGANMISIQRYPKGVSDFRHLFRAMKGDAADAKKGAIQAIYCPIVSSADIGVVTSQLQAFSLDIIVLGSDEWNDDEELDRNKNSADGVIFTSDRWDDEQGGTISGLSFESFGYDAASLLLRCLDASPDRRLSLQQRLASVREYDGIHSKISFTDRRVNSFLHILQYKNGFIKKIADIHYQP